MRVKRLARERVSLARLFDLGGQGLVGAEELDEMLLRLGSDGLGIARLDMCSQLDWMSDPRGIRVCALGTIYLWPAATKQLQAFEESGLLLGGPGSLHQPVVVAVGFKSRSSRRVVARDAAGQRCNGNLGRLPLSGGVRG